MKADAPFAHPHKRLERLVFFSDAVFAIAITLLALELRLPDFSGEFTWNRLDGLVPRLIACAMSYAIVGISWWAHTRVCRYLISVNDRLIAFNLLRLFFITIIPLPASTLMEHGGSSDSWAFYALTMSLSGAAEVAMWRYASSQPELVGPLTKGARLVMTIKLATTPVAFVISAVAAYFGSFNAGWIALSVLLGPAQAIVSWRLAKISID